MRPSLLLLAASTGALAYDLVPRQRNFGECDSVCSLYSESLRVCNATVPNSDISSCMCIADNAAGVQGCINCASQTSSPALVGAAQGIVDAFSQLCDGMGMASITPGGPGGSGGFTGSARPSTTTVPGTATPTGTGTRPTGTTGTTATGPGSSASTSGSRNAPSQFPNPTGANGGMNVMGSSLNTLGLGLFVSFIVAAVAL